MNQLLVIGCKMLINILQVFAKQLAKQPLLCSRFVILTHSQYAYIHTYVCDLGVYVYYLIVPIYIIDYN